MAKRQEVRAITPRIPMYLQIRQYVLDCIERGLWQSGQAIPSENVLAEQFKVSRITVKQAFEQLVESGAIYRVQGKGTFIAEEHSGEPKVYSPETQGRVRKRLIGYLAPRLNNMFTANILSGIEGAAAKAGYRLLFARTHDLQELEESALRELIGLDAAGILIYPAEGETYNEEILRLILGKYPLVVVSRYMRGIEADCVYSDNLSGGILATRHLLELGHRSIGFISHDPLGTSSVEDRLSGYRRTLLDENIPVRETLSLLKLKSLQESNRPVIQKFLESHPELTAVIAVNSPVGQQVYETAQLMGIRIPEDLSLVQFDNHERLPTFPTYIRQNETETGETAVKLLLDAIENPDHQRTRQLLPVELVVGQTTASPRR